MDGRDEEGFVRVCKRKKKSRNQTNRECVNQHLQPKEKVDKVFVKKRITECREELRCGEFYPQVSGILKSSIAKMCGGTGSSESETANLHDLVCYGIGNFATCLIARYQMALMMALREDLQVPKEHCYFYDPVLLCEEEELIREMGFNVIPQNEQGKRLVKCKTLFYMPHCGKPLYNNVIWSNWTKGLGHVLILGNSFSHMKNSLPVKTFTEEAKYISTILPYTEEVNVPNTFRFNDIFNNTSVHFFPSDRLSSVPEEVWQDNSEPEYDVTDAGIILE